MVLDSIQADKWADCLYSLLIKEAPSEQLMEQAKEQWGDTQCWRFIARAMAEVSPSVFRGGDMSSWVRTCRYIIADYYYELQKPPERLQEQDKAIPWIDRV